jgi:RHS repeat-associated protein
MEGSIGLQYFNARWYDSYITQFSQPDSIIPDLYNPLDWNRYSYVRSNPVNATDPSGHDGCGSILGSIGHDSEIQEACRIYSETSLEDLKDKIKEDFGIEMVDGTMDWSINNVRTAYGALDIANDAVNGTLKSRAGGTKYTMASQAQCVNKDTGDPFDCYHGKTDSTGVTFYSSNASVNIPSINFLHETGHLLDSVPATANVYSDPLRKSVPKWVVNGYVNIDLLGGMFKQPVQAIPMIEPNDPNEYWADAFANYAAGNINLAELTGEGQNMFNYVYGAINPYAFR